MGRVELETVRTPLIAILTALNTVCGVGDVLSVSCRETTVEAVLMGVPEIRPLEERVKPEGRAPAARAQV